MNTISDLEKYLECNGYSFTQLSIGKHYAHEGIIIEKEDDHYNFSYSERGQKNILRSFDKEQDLVQYARKELDADEWSRAHLLAATFVKEEILEAEDHLRKMNIAFRRNDIPNYEIGKTKYRIFVFGTDINRLTDFKSKGQR